MRPAMSVNPATEQKLLLSVNEAAVLLSLGVTTVKNLIATGRIESIVLGLRSDAQPRQRVRGRRLIPRQALEDFVERERARQREGGADE